MFICFLQCITLFHNLGSRSNTHPLAIPYQFLNMTYMIMGATRFLYWWKGKTIPDSTGKEGGQTRLLLK